MRKALSLSIIVTVLAVMAYFTKPSEEECIIKAKEEFTEKKLSYTIQTLPAGVHADVFKETAEKGFLQSLTIEDKFFYKAIYQKDGANKKNIGWGVFGWVKINLS